MNPLFYTVAVLIVVISIFFRTSNYNERIYIQADNSRDVQVARYAADNLKIPQIGQFSSAGPFFYGPWYYWFLEIVSFLPLGSLTHWYAITGIYLIFIYLIYWLGKETGGKYVGILSALFAAISPAQINYSFSTWNPAIVPMLSLLILIFLVRIFKYGKIFDIFILGFLTALSISIHFQSILLFPTLLVVLFLIRARGRFLINLLMLALGFLIPLLPLIYFDVNHNWYNFKSLFIFLAIDQYNIYVPNRWLTYVGSYWPEAWGFIVGGSRYLAGLIIVLLSLFSLFKLKDFSKNKVYFLLTITFLLEIIMYRYYRGERFQYYSLFAHPAIFVLTAWVANQIIRLSKFIGFIFVVVIVFSTSNLAIKDIAERSISYPKLVNIKQEIYEKYPDEKFDIYGCKYNAALVSHPLALLIYFDGRNEARGVKIGVCNEAEPSSWTVLETTVENSSDFWIDNSTAIVYESTVEWWKHKPPGGGGDFWQFLKKNLNPKCYPRC